MKIKISYQPSEEAAANAELSALQVRHPGSKIKISDKHPPFKQAYIAVKEKLAIERPE